MKVAVLGATGFIGSWATRALVSRGATVVALARAESDCWRIDNVSGVSLIRSNDWAQTLRSLSADAVLSLDWSGVSASDRDDDELQAENVKRQKEVSAAAFESGVGIFVGSGSQAEYGPVDAKISEDRPPAPVTAYGRAKSEARIATAGTAQRARARWAWARIFSVFGPMETGPWLLPSIAQASAEGGVVSLSSGTQPWSYLYAADAGRALAELVLNSSASGIFNVGHPDAPPLRSTIEKFSAALTSSPELVFGENAGARLEPDVSRLESLGWAPTAPLDASLAVTARWLQGEAVVSPFDETERLPRA